MRINNTQTNYFSGDAIFVGGLSALSASYFAIGIDTNGYSLSGNALNLAVYDNQIHVSQVDGNDTTGNGDLLRPVKTITQALTLVSGNKKNIIVHPGYYQESPSITVQSTVLNSYSPLGGTTLIDGTLATSVGCTIAGFQIGNLNITAPAGVGDTHVIDCTVTGTLNKSGNAAFTEIHHSDVNVACNVTGTGLVAIDDCNANFLTVNNAAANVIVRSAASCVAPNLISGTMSIVGSVVIAAAAQWVSGTTYAVGNLVYNAGATYARIVAGAGTTAPAADTANWLVQAAFGASDSRIAVATYPNSVVTIANCQVVVPTYDNVARVSLNGFYSILDVVYDKPNSTLVTQSGTGGSTNSIDYFQYINADKMITPNGNSDNWNAAYTNVATLSTNGTFNLYLRNANLATLSNWTSAVSIPANINELTGGGPCIVSDILCIIKNRSLNAGVPTTGNLFSTNPSFSLEDTSSNSFCSTATIGKSPVVGAYYRTANGVGTANASGKFTYNGGAARVVGVVQPVYITTTLTAAVNGTTFALPINVNTAFSGSDFHVKVDDEIMYVSNVTGGGTSMTVTRGQLGTAQATHALGATVTTNIATNDMLLVDACFVMKRFES